LKVLQGQAKGVIQGLRSLAIIRAARRIGDKQLERAARRELAERFGIKVILAPEAGLHSDGRTGRRPYDILISRQAAKEGALWQPRITARPSPIPSRCR
jgi:hypothetical protein